MPILRRWITIVLLSKLCLPVRCQWKLLYQEDFSSGLPDGDWYLETYDEPFDTIMDDTGDWYKNDYGPAFTEAFNTFDTYRKEVPFGTDNWLTASFSVRDDDKTGTVPPVTPTLEIQSFGSGNRQRNAITMTTPRHTGGVILRPSQALPDEYRIEYKLMNLDYGGKRQRSIVHPDGKVNGYKMDECKTQHPWGEGSRSRGWSGNASVPYCDWQSVVTGPYAYNGFHFLAIVDFENPAPRNNHFWHIHRKVLMDSFSQHPDRIGTGSGGSICNSQSLQYYNYSDSLSLVTLNMWINSLPGTWSPAPGGLAGTSQRFITDCNSGKATRGIQSAGEMLTPEMQRPGEYYTFAIERNTSGYTLEASGMFAGVEHQSYRFYHPFEEGDEPIWHYNVKADEYSGQYNGDLRQDDWDFGSQAWPDQWPAGSAYPDFFVIGDLYTNVYEGTASIADIRLYVPDDDTATCTPTILLNGNEEIYAGDVIQADGYFLKQRKNGALEVWSGSPETPGILYWDNGVDDENELTKTYLTKLQNDGNLITWRVQTDGSRRLLWKSFTAGEDDTYTFVVDCERRRGGVAVYKGSLDYTGSLVWREDDFLVPGSNTNNSPASSDALSSNLPSTGAPTGTPETLEPSTPMTLMFDPSMAPTSAENETTIPVTLTLEPSAAPTSAENETEIPVTLTLDPSAAPTSAENETLVPSLTLDPPAAPSAAEEVTLETCTDVVVLLNVGDLLYIEQFKQADADLFLFQNQNSNLELWEGTPGEPARLLWETGQDSSTVDAYYTLLQSDSNLVTLGITRFNEFLIWETGTTRPAGLFQLALARCDEEILIIRNRHTGEIIWKDRLLTVNPFSHVNASNAAYPTSGGYFFAKPRNALNLSVLLVSLWSVLI